MKRRKSLIKAQDKYFKSSKGKYQLIKQSGKKREIGVCSVEEFSEWWKNQSDCCFYCGEPFKEKAGHIEKNSLTIDRCNNKAGYFPENMVVCCYRCNQFKGNDLTKEDMIKIGNILKEIRLINK